ncbi:MAG: DMT family transporter, partial [Paramuribaculum sp.]|nr:DMT family transporter [Paramuribaculum sp.]
MNNNRIYSTSSRSNSSNLIFHICALIAVTAWGIAFINTKALMTEGLSAVEVYVYRFVVAYVCVFLVCPRPLWSHSFSDEVKFMLCGLCGNSIYFIAENTALDYTLVTNVSLIVTLSPIITALLVGMMYKSQRPTKGFMTGSIVAFIGVGCVIFNSSFMVEVKPLGDMLALLAAVCWAVYSILLRPLNAIYNVWFITRKTFFYGLLTSLPFLLVEPSLSSLEVLLIHNVQLNYIYLEEMCSIAAKKF